MAYLQVPNSDTASVAVLARCVKHADRLKGLGRFIGPRHVGAFDHANHTVLNERGSIFGVVLVLRCAWQGYVYGHMPAPRFRAQSTTC